MNTTKSERKRIRNRNKRTGGGGGDLLHNRSTGPRNIRRFRQRRGMNKDPSSLGENKVNNNNVIHKSILSAELDLDMNDAPDELQQQQENLEIASITYLSNGDDFQQQQLLLEQMCIDSSTAIDTTNNNNKNASSTILLNDHHNNQQIMTMDQLQCITSSIDMPSSTDFIHHQILSGGNEVYIHSSVI